MSTTIDNKVVEMRFDNKHFQKNVSETMSTLDKLKQKLNLTGASKGLENLNTSANKVNMNGISNAVDTVHAKFSALEVMGVTALANITNSAVEAGKRFVKALTVEPVMDGWQEYEMTLNAIQTTMAGTGKTSEEVSKELKKLDEYADKTVYSTADMLNNLPKFTNAGVDLEVATKAMIGIANATAHAGGDASKASIAFYNLGQAIGTGYLTRMDYNSINNAGIATMQWKEQMVEAAIAAGTLKKVGEDSYQVGKKTMTLQQLFIDGLQEQWASTDVMIKVFGDYGDETTEIGKKAYESAQDIKTFTMMMESLKATAGTGWKDTWEIIFGDLEEAKEFWTGITNFISNIIESVADFRNKLLEGALGRTFSGLFDKIKKSADIAKEAVQPIKDYVAVVDEIISGKWGNTEERWNALAEAGYDWAHAQNLVNEKLGNGYRRATNYKKAQDQVTTSQEKAKEMTTDYIIELIGMSDAQLVALGYTEEQIEAFRELEEVSRKTGIPLREFIENIDEIDGRWILLDSLKNVGESVVTVFKAIKDAWLDAFPAMTSDQLFDIIANFHKFSEMLVISEETADKLTRTFKGVFAILDIVVTLITGPIGIAVKILFQFLQALDLLPTDFLGITATIGDAIVKFRDWLEATFNLREVFEKFAPQIREAGKAVGEWFKNLRNVEPIKTVIDFLIKCKNAIGEWLNGLMEAENIGQYVMDGLVGGFGEGIKKVIDFVINIGKSILEALRNVFDTHSPSKETWEIGKDFMMGFLNGLKEIAGMVYTFITTLGGKLIEIVKDLDLGSLFTIALGGGMVYGIITIARAFDALTGPLDSIEYVVFRAGKVLKSFSKVLNGISWKLKAEAIKAFATSIAILVGSIVVLTLLEPGPLIGAIVTIGVLMAMLVALTYFANKYGGEEGIEFGKIALSLLGLAAAMGIMALALRTISKIESDKLAQTLIAFGFIMTSMMAMMIIVGNDKNKFAKVGSIFMGLAGAFLLMAWVVKILGKMDQNQLIQGTIAITAFGGIIVGLMAATKLLTGSKNVANIGSTIFKVAGAILMMIFVAKIAGDMDREALIQGGLAIVAFSGIIVGLMAATKLISGSKNVGNIGVAIAGIAGALLTILFAARIAAGMEPGDLVKGGLAVTAFGGIIVGLMAATKLIGGSKNLNKIGKALLMISFSIGILAVVAALLSLMSLEGLAKGVTAVGFLSAMMAGLIFVTKYAKKSTGTIVAITVAIGVLAIAMAGLSMIDTAKLAKATVAISVVVGMLALLIASTGSSKKATTTILVLMGAIALLAGALFLLGQIPADRALASAGALSLVMGALAGTLVAVKSLSKMGKSVLTGMLGILALVGILYLIIGALALMQGIENASQNALTLAVFMGALAVVQLLCAAAGAIYGATAGIATTGLLGMVALIGTIYVLLGALAIMSGIPDAITNLTALQTFMLTMTGVLIALAIVGPLALVGVGAMAGLIGLMVVVGALAVAIGALNDKFPHIKDFLVNGLPVLVALAGAIGEMIGAFVKGVMTKISSALPEIGTNLSMFMMNAMPFITGAKLIDGSILKGVGILAGAVLLLTATDLLTGIASFLSGGSSFAELGTELSAFMMNALPFILLSKMIDPDVMTGIKSLAEAVMILTGANILEGLTKWFAGSNSLEKFGSQLGGLGTSLNQFVTNIGTFTQDQVATVDCAGRAIKALAEAASTLPNDGGWLGAIVGENSIGAFGAQLGDLGTNLKAFMTNLGTFDESHVTSADCAGRAISALANAAKEVPNDGGLWGKIFGENSLATFGSYLPSLGANLKGFITNLGEFDSSKIDTVNCACQAITALANAANGIPSEGSIWGKIFGEKSLSAFADKLPDLATDINGFVTNLGDFSDDKISTVYASVSAMQAIAKFGEIDLKDTGSKMETFGSKLVTFGSKIKEFVEKVSTVGADGIVSSVEKVIALLMMAQTVASTNIDSLKTFGQSLRDFAKDGVKGFVDEFSGFTPQADAKKAVKDMVQAGIDGAEDKKDDVKKSFTDLAKEALGAIGTEAQIVRATQAGKDLVQGLINGLSNEEKKTQVYNAAFALGQLAVQGELDGQQSNSPSEATRRAGLWLGQGLINGIVEIGRKVNNAGRTMGEDATNSISNALNTAFSLVDSNMDSQPTIRPVLDLSDVESGVGYLGSLFNNGPSLAVAGNLGAISSGMNSRSQNGTTNDVISAINKLRKDLGNVGGDTYNVNGITYDDGTNISDAVRTLIRAAKMERRV